MATIKGIWVLNDIQLAIESDSALAQTVNFTSNDISFDRMVLLGDYTSALTYSNQSDSYSVYTASSGWVNQNYRMVDFGETEQTVSDEWYTAFTKNAIQSVSDLYSIELSTLTGIANAVRAKTGKTDKIPVTSLATEIENITTGKTLPKYDGEVIIEGEPESGGDGGGSAEFNIAYGDTAPEDTTKLWVKANEPEVVSVTSFPLLSDEKLEAGVSALPAAAYEIGSAAVDTKVYLFGGRYSTNGRLNTINVFDTEIHTIETLSITLPTVACYTAAAVVGTKVYLFGGLATSSNYLNTINVFDTETKTIETLSATLPKAAFGIAAAVVGTKVYLFGGYGTAGRLSAISVFDTETKTIEALSVTLPQKACYIAAAAVGAKVYLFGGSGDTGELSAICLFDTKTRTIETLNVTLPSATSSIASAFVGTKVYLFGGGLASRFDTINVFDTEIHTIETLSITLPTAARAIASAVVGTEVYLFGGQGGSSAISAINVFLLSMPLASNNMLIEANATKNRFNLLPNVELGINNVYLGNADGNGERVDAYLHNGTEWVEV